MKLPSLVWIIIIVAAVAAGIGLLYGGFVALTHIQWLGSAIALVIGFFWFRMDTSELGSSEPFVKAMLIVIFAAVGSAIDQPGNPVYNKPMEWIYCPSGSELVHEVERGPARGGGIRVSQRFTCVDPVDGSVERQIGMMEFFGVRFGEYVLIGYSILGVLRLIRRFRKAEE